MVIATRIAGRMYRALLAAGRSVAQAMQHPGVSEQTFHRWRTVVPTQAAGRVWREEME
jgi:hypothetical protein